MSFWHLLKDKQPEPYKPIAFMLHRSGEDIEYEGFYDGYCMYYMTFRGAQMGGLHKWRYIDHQPQVYQEEPHTFYYPGNYDLGLIDKQLLYSLQLPVNLVREWKDQNCFCNKK